MRNQ
jgi:hypothetical protein